MESCSSALSLVRSQPRGDPERWRLPGSPLVSEAGVQCIKESGPRLGTAASSSPPPPRTLPALGAAGGAAHPQDPSAPSRTRLVTGVPQHHPLSVSPGQPGVAFLLLPPPLPGNNTVGVRKSLLSLRLKRRGWGGCPMAGPAPCPCIHAGATSLCPGPPSYLLLPPRGVFSWAELSVGEEWGGRQHTHTHTDGGRAQLSHGCCPRPQPCPVTASSTPSSAVPPPAAPQPVSQAPAVSPRALAVPPNSALSIPHHRTLQCPPSSVPKPRQCPMASSPSPGSVPKPQQCPVALSPSPGSVPKPRQPLRCGTALQCCPATLAAAGAASTRHSPTSRCGTGPASASPGGHGLPAPPWHNAAGPAVPSHPTPWGGPASTLTSPTRDGGPPTGTRAEPAPTRWDPPTVSPRGDSMVSCGGWAAPSHGHTAARDPPALPARAIGVPWPRCAGAQMC